jgi:hypothetical protein
MKFIRSTIVCATAESLANTKKISKQKLKKLANMKTLKDLFELIAQAVSENGKNYNTWFFRFSGHVNHLGIDHHTIFEIGGHKNSCDIYLTEEGIQEAYWFIKNRLKK